MARKSRKAEEMQSKTLQTVKAKYRVAVYARLSSEKEETLERGTIDNQVDFVRDYVNKQEDMEIYDIYVDDSFTGTNFERPGFTRMMADMRAGRINTIVVKDLSRLGRDYLETGNLIERVFPMYELRFIAVLDGYDSSKSSVELMIPVTNIANALYAVDISKKIYSSKQEKMDRGIPVGIMPYGYKAVIGEDHVRQMVIDEEPAGIIRRIYNYYLEGKKAAEIAKILNAEKVPTPYQYKYRDKPEILAKKTHLKWNTEMIARLMRDEVYTGKYVMGKDTKCLYRHEKRHTTQKEEWRVFENHHEAILSREEFRKVNELRPQKDYKANGEDNLLKGKVVCGKCGSAATVWMDHHKGRYYVCARKHRFGASSCDCCNIREDVAYDMVFKVLREEMQLLLEQDKIVKALKRSSHVQEKKKLFTEAMGRCTKECGQIRERKSGLYRDFLDELLTEDEYIRLNKEYTAQHDKLTRQIEEYAEMLQAFENDPMEEGNIKELFGKFIRKRKLSPEMVNALVEKVVIHEGKKLEVLLKFEDIKKKMLEKRTTMEGWR